MQCKGKWNIALLLIYCLPIWSLAEYGQAEQTAKFIQRGLDEEIAVVITDILHCGENMSAAFLFVIYSDCVLALSRFSSAVIDFCTFWRKINSVGKTVACLLM